MSFDEDPEDYDDLEDSNEQKEFLRKPFRRVNEYRRKSKVQRSNKATQVEE